MHVQIWFVWMKSIFSPQELHNWTSRTPRKCLVVDPVEELHVLCSISLWWGYTYLSSALWICIWDISCCSVGWMLLANIRQRHNAVGFKGMSINIMGVFSVILAHMSVAHNVGWSTLWDIDMALTSSVIVATWVGYHACHIHSWLPWYYHGYMYRGVW